MNVKVKICGIRNLESAQTAVDAGADFLGFNFIPGEKRYIHPSSAKKIIDEVKNKIQIVGVFQNNEIDYVNTIVDQLDLDYAQLHGNETYSNKVHTKVIKTIHAGDDFLYTCDYFLLDREENTSLRVPQKNTVPVVLAGGLNCENVAGIAEEYKPFAVDVARGVETDGVTDVEKILEFVKQAKGVLV